MEEDDAVIVYACVAYSETLLCHHAYMKGNYLAVVNALLPVLFQKNQQVISESMDVVKRSYQYDDGHIFHYEIENGTLFMVLCDANFGRLQAFTFLEDLRKKFFNLVPIHDLRDKMNLEQLEYQNKVSKTIKKLVKFYNEDPESDKIKKAKKVIEGIKEDVKESIDLVLQRGEKLELLVDKTEQISSGSYRVRQNGKRLKRAVIKNNILIICLIFGALLFLGIIVGLYFCGTKCFSWTWEIWQKGKGGGGSPKNTTRLIN